MKSLSVTDTNPARGSHTTQQSTLTGYVSELAVDGNINTIQHSSYSRTSWWYKMDLLLPANITSIKLYNRKGCCRKFNTIIE